MDTGRQVTTGEAIGVTGLVLQAVFGIRWLLGLEGRIGSHELTCNERQKRLDERHDAILRTLQEIKTRLE